MPGSVGAFAAAKKKKKPGAENLEKAFEKADISSDGKVSFLWFELLRIVNSFLKSVR